MLITLTALYLFRDMILIEKESTIVFSMVFEGKWDGNFANWKSYGEINVWSKTSG